MTRSVTVALRATNHDLDQAMRRSSGLALRLGHDIDHGMRVGRASTSRMTVESNRLQHSMRLTSKATALAGGLITGSLAGVVVASVNAAASFETTMRQIAVATGAPASSVKRLGDLALKMGQDTTFSAQDAGQAMLELAKGGMNEAQIRAGALSSTLTLASAGGLGLAESAGYVVQGLSTFNLKADQAANVAAALAGGANASTASVQDMGQALSQVGPGAQNAGLTLQETTAVLAAFAQNGIKGADAGTSLKTMLSVLVPQTKQQATAMKHLGLNFVDSKGQFKDITDVAQQLHDKLGGLSQAQRTTALNTIFGSDASRAAAVLMKEGAKGVREYIKATSDKTQADQLAEAATSGTAGALSSLSGSIDTAKLQLGQALSPLVQDVANRMTGWTNDLSTKVIPTIADFVKGMEDGTGPGGKFATILGDISDAGMHAWHFAEPILSFIGDHPKLFEQIAVGAGVFAVALKMQGIALGVQARLLPTVIAGQTTMSTLNGVGMGGIGAGATGGVAGGRAAAAVGGVGRYGTAVGVGALSGSMASTSTSSQLASLGMAAATGAAFAGLPGAVAGFVASGVVMGFNQGAKEAAASKAALSDLKTALAGKMTQSQVLEGSKFRKEDVATADGYAAAVKKINAEHSVARDMAKSLIESLDATRERYQSNDVVAATLADNIRRRNDQTLISTGTMAQALTSQLDLLSDKSKGFLETMTKSVQDSFAQLGPLGAKGIAALNAVLRSMNLSPVADASAKSLERILHDLQVIAALGGSIPSFSNKTFAPGAHSGTAHAAPKKAAGGLLKGPGTGTSDSILGIGLDGLATARVSNGEFVVNAEATSRHLPLLKALNTDGVLRLAGGGVAGASSVYRPGAGSLSSQAGRLVHHGGADAITSLVSSYDAYNAAMAQAAQRERLLADVRAASNARAKASAKDRAAATQQLIDATQQLHDFDKAAAIDKQKAATDRLLASLQKQADLEQKKADAELSRQQIMDNKFTLGLVSAAAEEADLKKRMAGMVKYSDAWMSVYNQLQQVEAQQHQTALDTVTFVDRAGSAGGPVPVGARSSTTSIDNSRRVTTGPISMGAGASAADLRRELNWLTR